MAKFILMIYCEMKLSFFLKFIHGGLLTGMPSLLYNPLTKQPLNIPLTIEPNSMYLNFKLTNDYSDYLNDYIKQYCDKLSIVPVSLFPGETSSKYLSVNIYNCTSPAFLNGNKKTLRCELNTYVKDTSSNKYGTLILDYLSNELSMDPVNLFKTRTKELMYSTESSNQYEQNNQILFNIFCRSPEDEVYLKLKMYTDKQSNIPVATSDELIQFSDNIYYKNGIYDKLYYDDSLVNAELSSPTYVGDSEFSFTYKDMTFERFDSIFYFVNKINFVGSMWENLSQDNQ